MARNIQGHSFNKWHILDRFSLKRLIVAVILFLIVLAGTILGVVYNQEKLANIPVPIIVSLAFATFSIIFVLYQLFSPLPPVAHRPGSFIPPKSPPSSSNPVRLSRPPKSPFPNKWASVGTQGLPSTNPKTILERQKVVGELYGTLTQQNITSMVLKGMVGIGKSTLAALISEHAERERLAGRRSFVAEALWISIKPNDTILDLARLLFDAFRKSVPNFESFTSSQRAEALFNILNTTKMNRLLVLDQFENLLDAEEASIDRSGVREWINILNRRMAITRVLFVSRFWPQEIADTTTNYIQEYHVKGLDNAEGVALLQKLGIEGTEEELRIVVEQCEGHPFALRFLATFLSEYHLSITTFLEDPIFTKLWLESAATQILDRLFKKQLSQMQRKVLEAFSVYREAVPLSAAEVLIDFNTELTQSEFRWAFDTLLERYLILEAGKSRYEPDESAYRLDRIVSSYLQNHLKKNKEHSDGQSLTLLEVHARAAQYYQGKILASCPPKEERRNINDVYPLIEAYWQLCQAEQYQQAYDLMEQEHIFLDLSRWNEHATLLSLYQMLLPLDKWHPESFQEGTIYCNIGRVYSELGQKKEAKEYFEQALNHVRNKETGGPILGELGSIYSALGQKKEAQRYLEQALYIVREVEDRKEECMVLNNLGLVYNDLGKGDKARKSFDQALHLCREAGDRLQEGRTLNNLGLTYIHAGPRDQAQKYSEQALRIAREVGDRLGEALALKNLGQIYDELGQKMDALKQALDICREVGNRLEEGRTLNYLGRLYADSGLGKEALRYYEQALRVTREGGDRWGESRTLSNLGYLYSEFERKAEAMWCFEQALDISQKLGDRRGEGRILQYSHKLADDHQRQTERLKKALDIHREMDDRKEEGLAWHNLAQVSYEQGHKKEAREYYLNALHLHREMGDRRREGLAWHNLAQVSYEQGHKKEAREYYLNALHLHREVGDRERIGMTLNRIGELYLDQQRYEAALASLLFAKMIFEEMHCPELEKVQESIDSLRNHVTEQRFAELSELVRSGKSGEDQIVEKVLSEII